MEKEIFINEFPFSETNDDAPYAKTIKCELNCDDSDYMPQFRCIETSPSPIDGGESSPFKKIVIQKQPFGAEEDISALISKGLSGIFKCIRCSFSCTSTRDLIAHYQAYREKEPFKCFQCGYSGANREDFRSHSLAHLNKTHYKCSKCSYKTESIPEIKKHVEGHSGEVPSKVDNFKCPLCDKIVPSKWNLKLHLGKCTGKSEPAVNSSLDNDHEVPDNIVVKQERDEGTIHTCPECFFIFGSKEKLEKHVQTVHVKRKSKVDRIHVQSRNDASDSDSEADDNFEVGPDMNPSVKLERIYLCPICHYVFTSVTSLNKHIVSHENVTECPICKFDCESNVELKEHLASHCSKESEHLCNICNMKFSSLGKLKHHIKDEHSRKFKCPYCPRTIKTENALRLHIEAHSKVKEFYCPKCDFAATNSSLLQFHMSRFHPTKKRFTCELCQKSYKYKYSLHRHKPNCPGQDINVELKKENNPEIEIDISQKEKLTCSECKASFKQAEHLKKHLLVHFNAKPFRCLKCGLRCSTKYNLSTHMTIHNIKANYDCKICRKKFKHRHALNNHFISHKIDRPYTCEVCGMRFKRKANYRRHYDIHSDIKPFRCHACDFTSRRKDGLQKHIQTHSKFSFHNL